MNMKFNINGYFRVKLTDKGREILKKEHEFYDNMRPKELRKPFALKETADGWYESQAWSIMETFGPHISQGGSNPFDTEIEIELEE